MLKFQEQGQTAGGPATLSFFTATVIVISTTAGADPYRNLVIKSR